MSRGRLAAVPEAARRDGAYVRVSATMGRAGDDFLSPTIQIDAITAASARTGGRILPGAVWEDIDVSGRSMDRPRLAEALKAAREGRVDRLWVYDLSRWARNAADGLAELAAIEKTGVEVLSATEGVDRSTTAGRLTAGVLLLLAEHYSDLIGDRWRDAITSNAERGVWHGRPPRGYVRTGRREIGPDPVTGPLWAEAFRRYAAGEGLRQVAVWLSAAGGRPVQPSEVSRTLRSPAYVGMVVLHGQVYVGRHEPLVDPDTWKVVQDRLEANRRVPSRTKSTAHPLAGLLRCDRCGGSLNKRPVKRGHAEPTAYCRVAQVDKTKCVGIGWPRLFQVEDATLRLVAERVATLRDGTAQEAAAEAARQARGAATRRTLADEKAKILRALAVLAEKLGREVLSDAAYRAAAAGLEAALAEVEAQEAVSAAEVAAPSLTEAASLGEALLELWPSMTDAERNTAARTLIREVRVVAPSSRGSRLPRRVRVVWRDGVVTATPRTASPQPQDSDTGRFLPRG